MRFLYINYHKFFIWNLLILFLCVASPLMRQKRNEVFLALQNVPIYSRVQINHLMKTLHCQGQSLFHVHCINRHFHNKISILHSKWLICSYKYTETRIYNNRFYHYYYHTKCIIHRIIINKFINFNWVNSNLKWIKLNIDWCKVHHCIVCFVYPFFSIKFVIFAQKAYKRYLMFVLRRNKIDRNNHNNYWLGLNFVVRFCYDR